MVQLLALLVLAAAIGAGVLWYRTRRFDARSEPWYVQEPAPAQEANAQPVVVEQAPAAAVVPVSVPQPVAEEPQVAVAAPVAPAVVPVAVATPRILEPIDFDVPDASEPRHAADGALRVETLAATFEEVEFLSSLGLATDAMDVLKTYLQDSSQPAPLAFFELMRLCEQDEDAAGAAMVRRRYARAFGVEAPRLHEITASLGLESLPELSARITRAWGTAEAPRLIEATLFSVPTHAMPLTLQAGRDLVCLYDLAMAIATENAVAQMPGSEAEAHPLAPWAHAEDPAAAQAVAQAVAEAQGGHRFALDVDLSVAPQSLPEKQEEPARRAPAPLPAARRAAAVREDTERAQADAEDAFSAAVASERVPVSRF
jgi:hypothetical protein